MNIILKGALWKFSTVPAQLYQAENTLSQREKTNISKMLIQNVPITARTFLYSLKYSAAAAITSDSMTDLINGVLEDWELDNLDAKRIKIENQDGGFGISGARRKSVLNTLKCFWKDVNTCYSFKFILNLCKIISTSMERR